MNPNDKIEMVSLQMKRTFCAVVICANGVPRAMFFPLVGAQGYATDPSAALHHAARTGIGTVFLTFFSTIPSRAASGVGVSRMVL